jgi:alkaline phosphatase D
MHLKPLVGPLFVFALISSAVAQDSGAVQRIAFGSCLWQDDPQAIWGAVLASQPDVFVFLGDNVYADTQDVNVMRQEYQKLAAKPGYQNLQKISQVAAIWDDHDYGENDAGRGYPMKEQSKRVFLDFFGEPENSARRTREGGIYTSYQYGPQGQRVQVILLDTRWARTPINTVSEAEAKEREEVGAGPYTATVGKNAWMLGEAQWRWLEAELRRPAELRIIATSIPFLQDGTGWETWTNFPEERDRLIRWSRRRKLEASCSSLGTRTGRSSPNAPEGTPYPLWEVNSSGMTENWEPAAPDKNRLGDTFSQDNYGLISIDWQAPDPEVTMEIRGVDNDLVMQNTIRLSDLQAGRE